MRRQTVVDMVNVFADVATSAPEHHDMQFAAVRFNTESNILFNFMGLGCSQQAVVETVKTMQLNTDGATIVDTGFTKAREMLTGPGARSKHGFRAFDVPLVIITITDGDTLEVPRLLDVLANSPYNKSSHDLLLLSVDDGDLASGADTMEEDDGYYQHVYSTAEAVAVTFDAIGRDYKFNYQCEDENNDATLRNLTQTILDRAPCTTRSPVVCTTTTT